MVGAPISLAQAIVKASFTSHDNKGDSALSMSLLYPLYSPCMNVLGFARGRRFWIGLTAHMYPACCWALALALMDYPRTSSS